MIIAIIIIIIDFPGPFLYFFPMKNPAAEQRGIFGREEKVLRTFLILPGLPRHHLR
jgi:hypothetical protein